MTDQLTYMTDAHKAVIKQLEKWGLGVMEEVDFPPFRADCYLPDYHVVVEVDGPQHSEKADNKRDRELCDVYGLFVFHISSKDASKSSEWKEEIKSFLRFALESKSGRWEQHKMKTPWL
ncbi:hypothetical protein LCGC14_2065500 [marine sediment metagenome]|uniref:DUF559 domain-containing protein n=1 Tax=marine sediment metagenome TaxID=412755 RepID=A0A0F9HGZ6_9ZZZZ